MRVVALKPILYTAKIDGRSVTKIYEKGEAFDIDDVSYYVRKKRGEIEDVNVLSEGDVVSITEGLPPLDEDKPTKKKKNVTDV